MDDLRELYQELIMDHNKKPRNFHIMENATQKLEGFNPLCGDRLTLFLKLKNGLVQDVSFQGSGCAISKASASMMTESLKGKTEEEALKLFHKFHDMLSREAKTDFDTTGLGKLEIFSNVCEFPARVKCATLAWHTLKSALEGKKERVTTE